MTKKMQEFYEYVSKNEELYNKFKNLIEQCTEKDALVQSAIELAGENGFVLTTDDFKEDHQADAKELSDDELENVAGGATCGCGLGGGGGANVHETVCGCFLGGSGSIYDFDKSKFVQRCLCIAAGAGTDHAI